MKHQKKKFKGTIVTVAFCLLSAAAGAAGIGDPAFNFSLPARSGETVTLEAYRGRVVLLNFWASWCAPCKEELPELEKLYGRFDHRQFEIVGINIDKQKKNALKYTERFKLSFSVLFDPDAEVIQKYPGRAMPISYLIDREGLIREVFFGFNREKLPHMEAAIRDMVNGSPGTEK